MSDTDTALSSSQVLVNNIGIEIVPNSLMFDDGFGEYKQRAASAGGGRSRTIFSEDAEDKIGKIKFDLFPTVANIKAARLWKAAKNGNVVEIPDMSRTMKKAAILNSIENQIAADGVISLEWGGDRL